ncbi:uncharacterized protein CBL_14189 [Carabus blaptoides fortunei]
MCTRFLILPVLIGLIVSLHETESAPLVARYQILPHVPGYVPVYIRKGDTPLEEINPELAEAFQSREEKADYREALGTKLDYISADAAPNASGDITKNYSLEEIKVHVCVYIKQQLSKYIEQFG